MVLGKIICLIGIVASLVMLGYGAYQMSIAPSITEDFWQSIGLNLFGMITFWAWVPVLISCLAYLWFDYEWHKDDAKWKARRIRTFGHDPFGDDW